MYAHNILFDPTAALITHLFLRDVFVKKYKVSFFGKTFIHVLFDQ